MLFFQPSKEKSEKIKVPARSGTSERARVRHVTSDELNAGYASGFRRFDARERATRTSPPIAPRATRSINSINV